MIDHKILASGVGARKGTKIVEGGSRGFSKEQREGKSRYEQKKEKFNSETGREILL